MGTPICGHLSKHACLKPSFIRTLEISRDGRRLLGFFMSEASPLPTASISGWAWGTPREFIRCRNGRGGSSQPNKNNTLPIYMVERNRVERGKLWKTGLIFAKGAAMRINANLEPAYLTPPHCPASFCASTNVFVYWCC